MLWALHSETINYVSSEGIQSELLVIWKRINPTSADAEGLGVDEFHAEAQAIVKIEDMPVPNGMATLIREGEEWAIRDIERQDEWTWIYHLAQPDEDIHLPERI